MSYKKQRLGTKLLHAARSEERYRDIHVFIGGTGAVGGTALLQMLSMYEEMMSIQTPKADDVPVLVTTGRNAEDVRAFTRRLFRFIESRHGASKLPIRVASGYITHSGVFVAIERFRLTAMPGIEEMRTIPQDRRPRAVRELLRQFGETTRPFDALMRAISATQPLSAFLRAYQSKHFKDTDPTRFRSVTIGIPIPSLVAYHLDYLKAIAESIEEITEEERLELSRAFRTAFRGDLDNVKTSLADRVIVAHTTAVGGMYDEDIQGGELIKSIRLGFSHSAQDTRLIRKQREAEAFAKEYAEIGINVLVTAAAIGIDEVRIRAEIPLHFQIAQKLSENADELFPGAKKPFAGDAKSGGKTGRSAVTRHVIRVYKPLTVPLDAPPKGPATFARGEILRPAFSIRSGENGFFSVSNADALYRVMRVASASELGQVLATVGLFGDDPISPWFSNNVCYYTETDNSRQVFDLLNQPPLLNAQISGLEPLALQDLGSAKHQGELHTLSLLILLHRLRTLDAAAIDPYVDLDFFDPSHYFVEHSRVLMFEDLKNWDIETLSRDLQILASAQTPQELASLIPSSHHGGLFPLREKAVSRMCERVLRAVWMIPSLGSPLIYESGGTTFIRTGYYAAPLDLLITDQASIETWLKTNFEDHLTKAYEEGCDPCSFEEFRNFHICATGFVDLRPLALLCAAKDTNTSLRGKVFQLSSEEALRAQMLKIEPYSYFTTSGLISLLFRLQSLHNHLQEAMAELGTLHEFRWQMPRDSNGHMLLVPGAVEAFRMVSEGLEKTTGTERLDGVWGYERRPIPDRWKTIPGLNIS